MAASTIDYDSRVQRARDFMREAGLDAVYVNAGANMRYFTGYSTYAAGWPVWFSALLLPVDGEATFLTNGMHRDIFQYSNTWVQDIRTHEDGDDVRPQLRELLKERGLSSGRIGVEGSAWIDDVDLLRECAPDAAVVSARGLFDRLRVRKEPVEVDYLRTACRASVAGFRCAAEIARPGADPGEVAQAVANAMSDAGGESLLRVFDLFSTRFSGRALRAGDVIPLDIGATVHGYHSDTSRTIFVGGADPALRRLYDHLLRAREEAIEAIRPGVPVRELHRIAAGEVARSGYVQPWRIGHGIGLSPNHEPPYLQEGNEQVVEPGMVFVLDPGVHVEHEEFDLPIAIEDVFHVTEDGVEWLTEFDLGPIEVR